MKKRKINPGQMAIARKGAEALHAHSEEVLHEAYRTLVRAAKAKGMSFDELVEERKAMARRREKRK